jgi:transcriptional regulator with XRE-family HTH domain
MRYQQPKGIVNHLTKQEQTRIAAFGKWLAEQRRAKGFKSQRIGAKAIGMGRSWLSDIESGRRLPTVQVAKQMARAYGLPPVNVVRRVVDLHPSLTVHAARLPSDLQAALAEYLAR